MPVAGKVNLQILAWIFRPPWPRRLPDRDRSPQGRAVPQEHAIFPWRMAQGSRKIQASGPVFDRGLR